MNARLLPLVLLPALIAGFTGCASVDTRPSGFLQDTAQMKPSGADNATAVYRDTAAIGHYHALIVEPVVIQPAAAAKLTTAEQVELSERLAVKAREIFSPSFTLVDEPATDALRLRIAVSDIDKSSPALNFFTTVVAFVPLDSGAISVEMEAVDSVTGARVAALIAHRSGRAVSPKDFRGSFSATGHARTGFAKSAQEMRRLLSAPETATQPY